MERKAGPALDRLVAQYVMKADGPEIPAYSTQMEAALMVVVRMRGDLFSFKLWQPALPNGNYAAVSFICGQGPCERHGNPFHNHHGSYGVDGESIPHAICLSALEALEKIDSEEA